MWKWEAETDEFRNVEKWELTRAEKKKIEEQKENAKWNCLIINEIWSAEEKKCVSSSHLVVSLSLHRVSIRSLCRHDMWLKCEEEAAWEEKNIIQKIFKRNTVEKMMNEMKRPLKKKGRMKKVWET